MAAFAAIFFVIIQKLSSYCCKKQPESFAI